MKKSLTGLLLAVSLLAACKKEKTDSTIVAMDTVDTTAQLKYRGVFTNGPYGSTMGIAKIYARANLYTLALDSFTVSNGPDLHVYVSKELQPLNFIDLGVLRTTSGTQLYSISGMPDFMEYKYALIHCQQFDHLFGSANLQ
ncbi:MAG: DM13 domain-containing protein [Chitinophagaceae bacterium]|nr:DM13 domain-containing protein [Chitinophagaceae bacterium]